MNIRLYKHNHITLLKEFDQTIITTKDMMFVRYETCDGCFEIMKVCYAQKFS